MCKDHSFCQELFALCRGLVQHALDYPVDLQQHLVVRSILLSTIEQPNQAPLFFDVFYSAATAFELAHFRWNSQHASKRWSF